MGTRLVKSVINKASTRRGGPNKNIKEMTAVKSGCAPNLIYPTVSMVSYIMAKNKHERIISKQVNYFIRKRKMFCYNFVKMFDLNTCFILHFKDFLQKAFIKVYELKNKSGDIDYNRCEKKYYRYKIELKNGAQLNKCENKELYYIANSIKEYIKCVLISQKRLVLVMVWDTLCKMKPITGFLLPLQQKCCLKNRFPITTLIYLVNIT